MLFGAGYATLKGRPMILWGGSAGAQCFILGSTFWFTRGIAANYALIQRRHDTLSFREELGCSSLSGSAAGAVGGALRGRSNIVPGAVVFGLLGLAGQIGLSSLAAAESTRDSRRLLDRLSESKWWPLKSIPDAEYEQQLLNKIEGLDTEIAMVDEQILELKRQRQKVLGRE